MNKSVEVLKMERAELLRKLNENEAATQEAIRRAEDHVSADEALDILAQWFSVNGTLPLPRILPVIKTLVSLRAEPDNESEHYFTWGGETPKGSIVPEHQFSVSLERNSTEVYLNDDFDQVAHSLTPDEAELLGTRLLGAAELGQRLQREDRHE